MAGESKFYERFQKIKINHKIVGYACELEKVVVVNPGLLDEALQPTFTARMDEYEQKGFGIKYTTLDLSNPENRHMRRELTDIVEGHPKNLTSTLNHLK